MCVLLREPQGDSCAFPSLGDLIEKPLRARSRVGACFNIKEKVDVTATLVVFMLVRSILSFSFASALLALSWLGVLRDMCDRCMVDCVMISKIRYQRSCNKVQTKRVGGSGRSQTSLPCGRQPRQLRTPEVLPLELVLL